MTEITVKKLANIVGISADEMLAQIKQAGLSQTAISQAVKDEDKKILLDFLKSRQSKSSVTLSLKKKSSTRELKGTKTVEITRKKTAKEPEDKIFKEPVEPERIDFSEVEKKRLQGEAFKKSEDERRKKQTESKTLVKRTVRKTNEVPLVNKKVIGQKKPTETKKRQVTKENSSLSNREKKELDLRKKRMVSEAAESTWKMIEGSNNPEDFSYFIEQFPESPYAIPAKLKLKTLQGKGQ